MKKLVKFSLATLAIATLAACSGGGGGGEAPAAKSNDSKMNNQPQNPQTVSKDHYGDVFYGRFAVQVNDVSNHPNKLVLDVGQGRKYEYDIAPQGIISPNFIQTQEGVNFNGKILPTMAVSGLKYGIKFGYVEQRGHGAVFYQGANPTAAETLKGKASYVGDAVYAKAGKIETQRDGVKLDVDFDSKTLSGTVFAAQNGVEAVTVKNAAIDGNSFAGKAMQAGQTADLKGKFFGVKGAEVGGAYADGKGKDGWQGAFGAKKQ